MHRVPGVEPLLLPIPAVKTDGLLNIDMTSVASMKSEPQWCFEEICMKLIICDSSRKQIWWITIYQDVK